MGSGALRPIRINLLVAACFLSAALAAEPLVLEGAVPSDVPDGAIVAAQVVGDDRSPVGEPVAEAAVAGGRFELALPEELDERLLEADRLGCSDDDVLDVAYLPFLLVRVDGEPMARLVLTDMPGDAWAGFAPPRHAYWLYTPEPFSAQGSCGGELDLSLGGGWSGVLMVRGGAGVRLTSEPAPEGFTWRYAPLD